MNLKQNMMKTLTNYLYSAWIQAAGEGWTKKQVLVSYLFSAFFAGSVVAYSLVANLNWSGIQLLAAAWIAWDLGGGVIGYNHKAIKRRTEKEESNLHFYHHNLLHIHPLLLIFFHNPIMLLGLTLLHVISFFTYVELLEVIPETGKRKMDKKGELRVIIVVAAIALTLIILSFFLKSIPHDFQVFGIANYCFLILFTLILINTPIAFQRTGSIMLVVIMIIVSMFITVPNGFEWFIPVYFLKLLAGYTAKEEFSTNPV